MTPCDRCGYANCYCGWLRVRYRGGPGFGQMIPMGDSEATASERTGAGRPTPLAGAPLSRFAHRGA